MDLYYHPLSSYSQKVLMAFYEKDIAFNPKLVELRDPEQRSDYLNIHPLGKIPFLVLDDGGEIPESSIIVEYLDAHYHSGTQLMPTDKDRARQVRCADRMYDFYLAEPVIILLFSSWKPEAERNQKSMKKAKEKINVMYDYMDKKLSHETWAMGDQFTMADCAAAPALLYAQYSSPFTDYPNIVSYWEKISNRPSCQKIFNEAKPYLAKLKQ